MKEIDTLIKRSKRYLESAGILLESGDYESSVSRTYYAMFYSVEALLLREGLSFSSHKGVISAFGERFVKTGVFPREMGQGAQSGIPKETTGRLRVRFCHIEG